MPCARGHCLVGTNASERHAQFRVEKPVEHAEEQDDQRHDQEKLGQRLPAIGIQQEREDGIIVKQRRVGFSHDPDIDAEEHGEDDDSRQQGRNPQVEVNQRGGRADHQAEQNGSAKADDRVKAHDRERGGNCRAEREGAFRGQVRQSQHAEGNHDREGGKGEDRALYEAYREQVEIYADEVHIEPR